MADSFTETSSRSWLGRITDSIKSVLVGLGLFVASFPLLFWNEGRAVQTARSLEEGAGTVISVPAASVDPANQDILYMTSEAASPGGSGDRLYRSDDGGTTFKEVLVATGSVHDVLIRDATHIYVSTQIRTSPATHRSVIGSKWVGPIFTTSTPIRRPVTRPASQPIVRMRSNVGTEPPTQRYRPPGASARR